MCYPRPAMEWRTVLIDIPAGVVDAWVSVYRWALAVTAISTIGVVVIVLLLATFGVRWGW